MEAAADQVDELEVGARLGADQPVRAADHLRHRRHGPHPRRPADLDRGFLTEEGRQDRPGQRPGRHRLRADPDGGGLALQFGRVMSRDRGLDRRTRPRDAATCCRSRARSDYPPGMSAARSRVAMAGLCRLLTELADQRAGSDASRRRSRSTSRCRGSASARDVLAVRVRMFNVQPRSLVGFIPSALVPCPPDGRAATSPTWRRSYKPLEGSSTVRRRVDLGSLPTQGRPRRGATCGRESTQCRRAALAGVTFPAEDVPFALIDGEPWSRDQRARCQDTGPRLRR